MDIEYIEHQIENDIKNDIMPKTDDQGNALIFIYAYYVRVPLNHFVFPENCTVVSSGRFYETKYVQFVVKCLPENKQSSILKITNDFNISLKFKAIQTFKIRDNSPILSK